MILDTLLREKKLREADKSAPRVPVAEEDYGVIIRVDSCFILELFQNSIRNGLQLIIR